MLKFRVEGQKLTWENPDEVVVAGTKKYLECYFEFDGDAWSGFENIEVFFKNGRDKPVRMLLSANRIWKEDRLCLSAGDWSVYLRAMVSKKKLDEEGNVIYEEDGVTPVMELDKQITSSTVSIRVLAHGQFENAQNSFESPEIAEQYIAQMLDIGNAMSVFEEYNPEKEYVKHNKVTFEGSSYVLMSERAQGVNPTDDGVWLLITERGKDGEKGTTIHTVNFGLSKVNPVGVRYSNYWRGEGMYLDFTMPKGFVEGDLLFDGGSGLMFNHSTARYSTTEHGETIMVTYDVITVIANLNGKDAVVDQELDWDSENAIANKTVAMKVNEIRSVMSAIEGTSARTDFSNVSNEDFRAKAEAAGVGGDDAGLADEKNYMVFKSVVSELPETANEGEVYKLVNEYYSVPINATDIVDDGNMLVFRTDLTSAFYKFISFTKDCMYGDTDITNFQTVDAYYYPNGKKTSFPWINSTWHAAEGTIAMTSDETFYKALINGGNMEFSYSDTTYLPDDLKSYSSEITKTYVYHIGEWVEISKDGYTPQKGVDYFTEADKQAMVQEVLNSLPDGDGVEY